MPDDSHMVAFNPQLHLSVAAAAAAQQQQQLPPYVSFPSLTNGDLLTVDGSCSSSSAAAAALAAAAAAGLGPNLRLDSSSRCCEGCNCNCNGSSSSSCCCNCSSSSSSAPVELWVLLSRHVRERQRDLSGKYLAVHVFEGSSRVCCPQPPTKQGVYSNGECTLVKVRLDPKALQAAAAGAAAAAAAAGGGAAAAAGGAAAGAAVGANSNNNSSSSNNNSNNNSSSSSSAVAAAEQQQHGVKSKTADKAVSSSLLTALDYVLVVSQYSQKVFLHETILI